MNVESGTAKSPLAVVAPPESVAAPPPGRWRTATLRAVVAGLAWFDHRIGARSWARLAAIVTVYGLQLALVFWIAYELRWDFAVPDAYDLQRVTLLFPIVACKLLMLYSFGQFRTIQSYFGLADFGSVTLAMATICGAMLLLWLGADATAAPPRGIILVDFVLSVAALSASRLGLRVARATNATDFAPSLGGQRRVAIVGTGDAGEALAKELLQRRGSGLQPVCFVDDDVERIGRTIHGLPVYGPTLELTRFGPKLRVSEVVIAQPGLAPRRIKELVELARSCGASAQIVPTAVQLASGTVKVERARPVAIEDLLGRPPVDLTSDQVAAQLRDRVVLVTGAGGSIGSELCRQILRHGPRRLILVDQAEIALFEIEQELSGAAGGIPIEPLIVDVAEEAAATALLTRCRPEVIFHAAAHKHVPIMERQPAEALKNNTLATELLTRVASAVGVAWFVLISTDKAINPTSVMGCSKRLAEMVVQARQRAPGNRTRFLAVRFGNVLGSSGSVIPVFRRQIAQGGPVTVTHEQMTRYFMTIPEAVGLVLQTIALGTGGEIFILDMNEPVRIVDLARQMIELSGYRAGVDIEIKFTGLRPGEKLFEELRHNDETHELTGHPRISRLRAVTAPGTDRWLEEIRQASRSTDATFIKQTLQKIVPEYRPYLS